MNGKSEISLQLSDVEFTDAAKHYLAYKDSDKFEEDITYDINRFNDGHEYHNEIWYETAETIGCDKIPDGISILIRITGYPTE